MNACAVCPRTAPDGQHLCPLCADDVRGWLAELPRQTKLLQEFLTPSAAARQGRIGGTGRAHSPVPVDLRVLVLLGPGHPGPVGDPDDDTDTTVPITVLLAGWAGHIAYTYPSVHRDRHGTAHTRPCEHAWPVHRDRHGTAHCGRDISAWCAWLTAYLPYTLTLPAAAGLHHQLGDLVRRVRDLTHATPHRHPQTAPCPGCDLFALVAVDGQLGVTCTACGDRLTPDEYTAHITATIAAHPAEPIPLDKIVA